MNYRENPANGNKVSILGFGCMRLPQKGMRIDYEETRKQILYAIEQGVNYFDTAWPYHNGESEVVLGRIIKDAGIRDKVFIADKLPPWVVQKAEDIERIFQKQLERLQTDYIDYYLIHALDGKSWDRIRTFGVEEFLKKVKAAGKIKNMGFSFHGSREDFKRIVDEYDWDFCQIQYNILDEQNQAGKEGLEYASSKGLAVVVMEPLRGGNLAREMPSQAAKIYDSAPRKRSNVEWALRWVWNHPQVMCILSGMNNMEHIKENIRIAEDALPDSLTTEELDIIKRVADSYRSAMKVPCTGCQYCMPCPAGVNIPSCFEHYNNYHMFGKKIMSKAMYHAQLGGLMSVKKQLASQCISCGKCVQHCPQSIDIPGEMKKVSKELEGFFINNLMKIVGVFFKRMGRGELKS
ncbi:MAG: aldo/keto reductase [Candidatus Cloacimonetes bacterium]|nr:aldo/keto reductase [Candidatus Cloacimonadota bacterium]